MSLRTPIPLVGSSTVAESGVVDPKAVRGEWKYIAFAAAVAVPAIMVRVGALEISVEIETLLYGIAILGAAFLLSWGAEVAQLEISQALAIAFLAFVAVLPEYAVSVVFAWKAGRHPEFAQFAVANMTGANRLLIGLGWATVVIVWWWKSREGSVGLKQHGRTDLGFLLIATLWAFTIPLRHHVSLLDLAVLGTMFVAYVWRMAQAEPEEPELVGPPLAVAVLPKNTRRAVTVGLFVVAAGVILAAAEPFADGLVTTGQKLHLNQFLLVQWLAPIASEAPEMVVAVLFVLRSKPSAGLGTLVSSKVNQWTLLIATIPLVYAISHGGVGALPLDGRQVEEVLLTAAQSVFAIAVLANLSISRGEAILLLVSFLVQFGFESTAVRYGFSAAYVLAALAVVARDRQSREGALAAIRDGFRPPWRARPGAASGGDGD
jgi:cation:H+ antiporter